MLSALPVCASNSLLNQFEERSSFIGSSESVSVDYACEYSNKTCILQLSDPRPVVGLEASM